MTELAAEPPIERATTRLVSATLQHSVLGGVAVWHGFVILAAFASLMNHRLTGAAAVWVVAVHAVVAVACLICAALRLPALPCLIGTFLANGVDLFAVSDWRATIAFAAIWTAGITCATPVLLLRPRAAIVVSAAAVGGHLVLQITLHPDWPLHVRLMVIVLAVILFVGVRTMHGTIDGAARRADEQAARARESARTERIARDTGREIAEDARVLHDTIINTLSLIARGRGANLDLDAVRRRAAHDAAMIRRLSRESESQRTGESRVISESRLIGEEDGLTQLVAALERHAALPIEYDGPSREDLERFDSLLPVEASRAIVRAVFELVTNAAKHSGAHSVRLRLELQPVGVVISVSDDGVGFTGEPVPGRGLAESVFRRCEDANVTVLLRSAPGAGTTVTLTYGMDREDREAPVLPKEHADLDARVIAAAGCWIWAGIIIGADLVLSVFRPPTIAAFTVAVAIALAVLAAIAWSFVRRRRAAPLWLTILIVLAVPAGYLAPFLAILGSGQPLLFFPALAGTVPLVILMMTHRSGVPLTLALVGLGVAVTVVSVMMATASHSSFLSAIVTAAPQLGLFAGWGVFVPVLTRAVGAYREQLSTAFELDIGAAAQNALTTARERWIRVGTRTSVALLDEIAMGAADPREPTVRRRCADEESYLRQLLLIDSTVLNLSPWLALALVKARSRSVPLEVRGGTVDSSDPATARLAGEVLLTVLDFCGASDQVIVSLFTEADGPVCLILGPAGLAPVLEDVIAANLSALECVSGASHTLISVRPPVPVAAAYPDLLSSSRFIRPVHQ